MSQNDYIRSTSKESMEKPDDLLTFLEPGAEYRAAALAYASLGLHVFPLKPNAKEPDTTHGWKDATVDTERIKSWWSNGSERNIGIALRYSNTVALDIDPRHNGDENFSKLLAQYGDLPRTWTVHTANKGQHYYYAVSDDFYERTYTEKLAPGVEFLVNKYVVAPPSELDSKHIWTIQRSSPAEITDLPLAWLERVIEYQDLDTRDPWPYESQGEDWVIPQGERNVSLAKFAGYFRHIGFSIQEIEDHLQLLGEHGRIDPYDDEAYHATKSVAKSIGRYLPEELGYQDPRINVREKPIKPELDKEKTLIGPIGDFVKFIEPISETHPAALLGQALAVFGNMIGAKDQYDRGPGFVVEDRHHKTSLYVMVVGDSAQAGKGDSWSRVHNLFRHVDETWKVRSGIQTGEGIVDQLADAKVSVNGMPTRNGIDEVDKRCMVYEPEFVRVLHVAQRQGAIIKDILRTMWDTGETEKHTASQHQAVTNATLSIVGHITRADLEVSLDEVDLTNGFGNRFLYVHAERTKFLPRAPSVTQRALRGLVEPFKDALEFAQTATDDYHFGREAQTYWDELGEKWWRNARKPTTNVQDQLSARARPLVWRMAVIYAIADQSPIIEIEHLEAAHAFWDYCLQTVNYVFGNRIGDPNAIAIYRALVENTPGLTKSEIIHSVFNRNKSVAHIDKALKILREKNQIRERKEKRQRKTVTVYYVPYIP